MGMKKVQHETKVGQPQTAESEIRRIIKKTILIQDYEEIEFYMAFPKFCLVIGSRRNFYLIISVYSGDGNGSTITFIRYLDTSHTYKHRNKRVIFKKNIILIFK